MWKLILSSGSWKISGWKIESTVIKQIPNGMEKVGEYYYWDIRKIFDGFIETLKSIVDSGEKIDSIGICTWGVDFAMFDSNGEMIQNPLCYRNTIGERVLASLSEDEKKKNVLPDRDFV